MRTSALLAGLIAFSAVSAASAAPLMSAEWAQKACEYWNTNKALTDDMAEKWAKNDGGRGYKVIHMYRTLEMLFLAKPDDLSKTTGIPFRLCKGICDKIQRYKTESHSRPVDTALDSLFKALHKSANELGDQHEKYETLVTSGWNDPDFNEKKKKYRKKRQECSLQINVILAELGEVELVEKMEKLPFDKRIDFLNNYLSSADSND